MKIESRAQAIAIIKERFNKNLPLNISAVKRDCPELMQFVYNQEQYWGWKGALEDAGLSYDQIKIEIADHLVCKICGFKGETLGAHINAVHGVDIEEYSRRFIYSDNIFSDKTRHKTFARRNSKKPAKIPHWEPFMSKEYFLDRLFYFHQQKHKLTMKNMSRIAPSMGCAARKYFGSWEKALKSAPYLNDEHLESLGTARWSKAKVIETIKTRYEAEEAVNPNSLKRLKPAFMNICSRYFPNFDKVLRAAGLNPKKVKASPYYLIGKSDQLKIAEEIKTVANLPLIKRLDAVVALRQKYDYKLTRLPTTWSDFCNQHNIQAWKIVNSTKYLMPKYIMLAAYSEVIESGLTMEWVEKNYSSLYNALIERFGTIEEAQEKLKTYQFRLEFSPIHKRIIIKNNYPRNTRKKTRSYQNKHEAICEIQRLYKKRQPLNISAVKRHTPGLIEFACGQTPYWGWRQALKDAGIDYNTIKIELHRQTRCLECGENLEQIQSHLSIIHNLSKEQYYEKYGKDAELISEEQMYIRQFTTTEDCGCAYPHWEPFYTREYILDRLHFYHTYKMQVNSQSVRDYDIGLQGAIYLHFNSWDEALELISLDPIAIRRLNPIQWSREFVMQCLLKRYEDKMPINPSSVSYENRRLYVAATRYFGSMNALFEALGFDPNDIRLCHMPYNEEDHDQMINSLRLFSQLPPLERRDNFRYIRQKYQCCMKKFYQCWQEAAETNDIDYWRLYPTKNSLHNKQTVVDALADFPLECRHAHWLKQHFNVLKTAAEEHFGSVHKAVVQLNKNIIAEKKLAAEMQD